MSYQGYSFTQALCNVHHLRELTFVEEELKQSWARKMKDLLLDRKAEVERAKALGKQEVDVLVLARRLASLCRAPRAISYLANPAPPLPQKRTRGRPKQSPARNLLDRLSQGKWAVLRFLHDFAVPFDNDVIAYCTPSAWLACLLKLTFILVMRVFARRWEQHDPTAISVVHGNAPSSPPIPDRLWRHSIGLSGFSGG